MSLIDIEDTIVAIASPTSSAMRGVVRLSGAQLTEVLSKLLPDQNLDGQAAHRISVDVPLGDILGSVPASLMWWPTRRSYTAQPSAEIHTYGSLPILTAVVRRAIESGARAARPGEFTMRAFLAGRLDLTQAEAVLGVIEAEGRGSLNHALEQLAGNLSRPLEEARSNVLDLLADVEAGLDFVDEDIEFIDSATLSIRLREIESLILKTTALMRQRGGGTDRPLVSLRGEPNAGKSCLFNCLTNQQAAIVSDVAGTTRDAVTCEATIAGMDVTLTDTAGLETTETEISQQSQRQGDRVSKSSRVRLWCVDASRRDFEDASVRLRSVAEGEAKPSCIDLFVANKRDQTNQRTFVEPWIPCSAITGEGIKELSDRIADAIAKTDQQETGSVVGTAARCRQSLELASESIDAALRLIQTNDGHELIAAELHLLAKHLGEVTGAVYTDDILDRVFSRFCIGK
ncbi:MAG: tRNA modification GTPase [Planctomycetota bacterium]